MKKLVLVNAWKSSRHPPLGLGYIASYLEKYLNFDNIEIIEGVKGQSQNLKEKIIKNRPDILGFTSMTGNYFEISNLVKEIKNQVNIPVILGGPHITSLPHKLPEYVDIGVIGEGEETVLELIKLFNEIGEFLPSELKNVKGIVYHEDGKNVITPPRELIEPLDKIPFPKRSLFDMPNYLEPANILSNHEYLRGTTMITTRGCPYRCIYCQVQQQWRKTRLHSAKYVANEIKMLVDEYKIEGIAIYDDLFIFSIKRIEHLIELLREYNILGEVKFLVNGRANLINEELLKLLKQLNVVHLGLGIESGSERVLSYLKKGTVNVEQNKNAINLANKYGIGIGAAFMMGTPTETKQEMLETLKFIREHPLMTTQLSVTTPLPGTELWDYCKKKGIVADEPDWNCFTLLPQGNLENIVYINEQVSFEEFLRIFKQAQREIWFKNLNSSTKKFLFKTLSKKVIYAIMHPKKTHMFVYSLMRNRLRLL